MRTGSEETAARHLAGFLPPGSRKTALGMVRLARYVEENGHQVPVCTSAADGGEVMVISDQGEWVI